MVARFLPEHDVEMLPWSRCIHPSLKYGKTTLQQYKTLLVISPEVSGHARRDCRVER